MESVKAVSACRRRRSRPRTTRRSTSRTSNEASLSPLQLTSELEGAFESLETGSISNEAVRDEGLCLLSGYFTDLSHPTLKSLYPTTASYASKFTTAANAEVSAGFMTPEDAAAAIANANAGIGPLQQPVLTVP